MFRSGTLSQMVCVKGILLGNWLAKEYQCTQIVNLSSLSPFSTSVVWVFVQFSLPFCNHLDRLEKSLKFPMIADHFNAMVPCFYGLLRLLHCVKIVRIRSYSGPNTGKYGTE